MPLLRRLLGLLALLAAVSAAAPLAAQDLPPRPAGPVYDGANIIDPAAEQALDAKLRAYNQETGRAVIVATVPSLQGLTIEMYAVELFETWGIGGERTDEGALLLVAPNEREVRIESGYGSTATLTDALSGRIIRNVITPRFKQGDYSGGITDGVEQIVGVLDADPATMEAINEAEAAARRDGSAENAGTSVVGVIFWVAMILGFMFLFGRGGRGRRRRRYGVGSAVGDVLLWTAISSMSGGHRSGGGWGGGGGGGGFGGFGGGMSGGGGASGSW